MDVPERCEACGRRTPELAYSCAVGAVVCERCHCDGAPPASAEALAYRYRPRRVAPRKPTRYTSYYSRVEDRLTALSDSTVFSLCDGTGRMLAYCPRCHAGTLCARIVSGPEPVLVISSGERPGCSLGCTEAEIAQVLFA
jgi:hypothetical protein